MWGQISFYLFIFLSGLCVGSFLNVILYRFKPSKKIKGLKDIKGRSFCPKCRKKLEWYELIPLLSFMLLRGRCLHCKQPISLQYPLIELLTGLVFVGGANYILRVGMSTSLTYLMIAQLLLLIILLTFFILLFVYDLKYLVLPTFFLYPALIAVLIFISFRFFIEKDFNILLSSLEGALVAGGFFALLVFVSRERWMGQGDIFLGILIGLLLGWYQVLVGLFLAFVSGGLAGIFLVLLKKKQMKSRIPFGPFLLGGGLIALFWGEKILRWYLY